MTTPRLYTHPQLAHAGTRPAGYAMFDMVCRPDQFGADRICEALFNVLSESQQERALQALGWQLYQPSLPVINSPKE